MVRSEQHQKNSEVEHIYLEMIPNQKTADQLGVKLLGHYLHHPIFEEVDESQYHKMVWILLTLEIYRRNRLWDLLGGDYERD